MKGKAKVFPFLFGIVKILSYICSMEDTMENNKLIAEFLGIRVLNQEEARQCDSWLLTKCDVDLMYHTSWNWLMEAVEKIEVESIYDIQAVYDNREEFKGWYPDLFTMNPKDDVIAVSMDDLRYETKIKATYKAVIEFIKWYNKNK